MWSNDTQWHSGGKDAPGKGRNTSALKSSVHHMSWTIPELGVNPFEWGKEGALEAEPEPEGAINFYHKALLTSIPAADSFFKGQDFCCVAQQDLEFVKQVLMCERKGFMSLSTGAAAGSSAAGWDLRSSLQKEKGQARGREVEIDFSEVVSILFSTGNQGLRKKLVV